MPNKYTEFIDRTDGTYEVWNTVYDQFIGMIEKKRVGTWMHWCLHFTPDFIKELAEKNEGLSFSNGCLKEISEFITSLYSKK